MKSTERPDKSLIVEDDASKHLESLSMEERIAPILQTDSFSMPEGKEQQCHCSFCGKSQKEVRILIAGPTVFICDECVDLCGQIVAEQPRKPTC